MFDSDIPALREEFDFLNSSFNEGFLALKPVPSAGPLDELFGDGVPGGTSLELDDEKPVKERIGMDLLLDGEGGGMGLSCTDVGKCKSFGDGPVAGLLCCAMRSKSKRIGFAI